MKKILVGVIIGVLLSWAGNAVAGSFRCLSCAGTGVRWSMCYSCQGRGGEYKTCYICNGMGVRYY